MGNLIDLYRTAAERIPHAVAFYSGPPRFQHHLTWRDVWLRSLAVAKHLRELGIQPGQRVGIMANSSWRWEVAQLACFFCRAVVVGIDPLESEKNLSLINGKAQIRFLFFEQPHWLEKWCRANADRIPHFDLSLIGQMDPPPEVSLDPKILPTLDDDAIVIFTSGTTSEPKGIVYTHGKVLYAINSILRLYPQTTQEGTTMCWLPLANLFQRIMNFCTVSALGRIYFIENPVEVLSSLPLVSPTVFASVPRFYEKIHDAIQAKIQKTPWPVRWFLKFGLWLAQAQWLPLRRFTLAPWEYLFFRKLRGLFGGRIKVLISGSAALRKDLAAFYHAIGLPVMEAYGVSEDAVPIAANTLKDFRLGSVGKPVIENSVKISPEGEVLVKNPGLFNGYLGSPDRTCFVDGYYCTGDLGHLDKDSFLYLQGRRTSIFKTTTGRKVLVEAIESHFKKLPFIDQVVILGEGRKLPLALLTLDLANLARFQEVTVADLWDQTQGELDAFHLAKIENLIRTAWETLEVTVKPAGALILPRRFSLERQEITPNLKLRTKAIERLFQSQLDQLYLLADDQPLFPVLFTSTDVKTSVKPTPITVSGRWRVIARLLLKIGRVEIQYLIGRQSRKNATRMIGQILREGLGTLKGPLQKVGQMMSYLAEDLPPEFREELSQLVREGSPVNSHIVRGMVEEELKRPLPAVFCEWQDDPVSSASIGQVHWARLTTGEEVAVKILNPGIERMLTSDMRVLHWALPILRKLLRFHSIVPHFRELRELLLAECNLLNEAQNLEIFGKLFASDPDLIIPKVYTQFSTRRVLVTDFIHGQSFEEFRASATDEVKQKAAEVIWTFYSRSINLYAIFNADPHPGNFVFTPGKVGFIDFGFCKQWRGDFIKLWKRQILAGISDDLALFERTSRAVGVINNSDPNFYRNLLDTYHRIIFLPWLKDEPFRFTHQFMKEYLRSLLESQISVPGLIIPQEFLSLSRLYWGTFTLMAELDAHANFYQLTIPYVKEELREWTAQE